MVILADAKTGCQFNLTVIDFAVGFSSLYLEIIVFTNVLLPAPFLPLINTRCVLPTLNVMLENSGVVYPKEILHRHELMDAFITVVDGNLHIFSLNLW